MNSIWFIWRCSVMNILKKNLRRPVFWIYVILLGGYACMVCIGFGKMIEEYEIGNPMAFTAMLSAVLLYMTPASYSTYAKRKGMLYRNCDVHFMFPSPVSPKFFLISGQMKTLAAGVLMEMIICLAGILWFAVPAGRMLLYFLGISIFGTVMNVSLVVWLYGNEKLKTGTLKRAGNVLYVILLLLFLVGVFYLKENGFHFSTVTSYLASPWVQMIPLIGWEIAAVRLIFLGPDSVNIIGTVLYLLGIILLVTAAVRMKCTGQYYEDAMKFADDYEAIIARKKKTGVNIKERKKTLRRAAVRWKGSGAAAIFYRQLLEYKKERFFLLSGGGTFIYLIVGSVLIYLDARGYLGVPDEFRQYLLLGIAAYLMLIFGSLPTKWTKELDNPYVFLIPDRPVKKIWYATCLEHVKALVNMVLLVIPAGIFMGISPGMLIMILWMGTAAGAVRMYSDTITRAVLGGLLGNTGRTLLQMLIAWTFIGVAVPFFLLGLFLLGETAAFLIASVYLTAAAFVLMLGGSHAFTKMELQD